MNAPIIRKPVHCFALYLGTLTLNKLIEYQLTLTWLQRLSRHSTLAILTPFVERRVCKYCKG